MKKNIISLAAALMLCCITSGQNALGQTASEQNEHEISVYGGGGLSSLQYKANVGKQSTGFGGLFGVGYHYFFTSQWAIGTGFEFATYNAKHSLDNYNSVSSDAVDIEGKPFEFRSTLKGYSAKLSSIYLLLPIMAQFQTNGEHKFYAALGGKFAFPVSASLNGTLASVQNSGYYAFENYEYTTQEFMGFGTFNNKSSKSDLNFSAAFFVSAEVGGKWKLDEMLSLYTGIYFDCGVNDIQGIQTDKGTPFVLYNSNKPREFIINATGQIFNKSKVLPIAAGIKLRLSFGISERDYSGMDTMLLTEPN